MGARAQVYQHAHCWKNRTSITDNNIEFVELHYDDCSKQYELLTLNAFCVIAFASEISLGFFTFRRTAIGDRRLAQAPSAPCIADHISLLSGASSPVSTPLPECQALVYHQRTGKELRERVDTMEPLTLRYFRQVAAHGSVRHAAERLFVAQSAVSRQVALLEGERYDKKRCIVILRFLLQSLPKGIFHARLKFALP